MSQRISTTGAAGFIGSPRGAELLREGDGVRALDPRSPDVPGENARRTSWGDAVGEGMNILKESDQVAALAQHALAEDDTCPADEVALPAT